MKIFIYLILLPTISFAGLFSPDYNYNQDASCIIKGFAKSPFGDIQVNRPIKCAIHKKKPQLNFCEGDQIVTGGQGIRVIVIMDKDNRLLAYAPTNASKRANIINDKVEKVSKFNCQERLKFMSQYIFDIGDRDSTNN